MRRNYCQYFYVIHIVGGHVGFDSKKITFTD